MLSTFQKKITDLAITCVSICVVIAFAIIFVKLFGMFLNKFSLVVWPLACAAILSVIFKPIIDFLHAKAKMSRVWAAILTFAIISLIFGVSLVILLPKAVNEIVLFIQTLPVLATRAANYLGEHFPALRDQISEFAKQIKDFNFIQESSESISVILKKSLRTALSVTSVVLAAGSAIAAFAVVPIYLFYMMISERSSIGKIEKNLSFINSNIRSDIIFLIKQFSEIMATFFRGQLIIALIMGLLLGAGFALAGIRFGFLIGLFIGLINIVPYLGTIIGLSTVLPLAYLQDGGSIWLSAIALAIFCAVQLIESYLLTPHIMGNRTGLHPMVIIFSVFFWGTALNGILGMILAIPLSAFIVVIWKLIKDKYLPILFAEKTASKSLQEDSLE